MLTRIMSGPAGTLLGRVAVLSTLAVAVALVLPAGLWAQSAAEKSPDQLWREVEMFQYLHALKLTADQARQAADLLGPVNQLALSQLDRERNPGVIRALEDLRAAALSGQPITEEMYKKLTTARAKAAAEWTDQASPTLWAAAAQAAQKIGATMNRDQLLAAVRYAASGQADTIVTGAMGQAEADPESWKLWAEGTLGEIAATNALAEGAGDKITALLEKIHGLSAEAAEAQKRTLCDELVSLMVSPANDEGLSRLAVDAMSAPIAENRELQNCLREYAVAVAR